MGILVGVFGFLFFPIAVGIGILRHRLYDIDLLINRTLVYGSLTVILVLAYVVAIVLSQGVFRALTGQGSQLAVVASTLAIAALFDPAAPPPPSVCGQALLPQEVRRQKDLGGILGQAQGPSS